jgi:hypothetical protein
MPLSGFRLELGGVLAAPSSTPADVAKRLGTRPLYLTAHENNSAIAWRSLVAVPYIRGDFPVVTDLLPDHDVLPADVLRP